MYMEYLLFAAGLLELIKGGDWFVDGAVALARRLRLPEIIIGATVVSIGTTLPEVMVSASSALSGHSQMAYGNAVGSVICNTALIAALDAAVRPGRADAKTLRTPTAFFFIAAAIYTLAACLTGRFTRLTGVILLAVFAAYMLVTVLRLRSARTSETPTETGSAEEDCSAARLIFLLAAGAALIAVGARLLVDNGTRIAQSFGVPESVIALTLVALGTSLPELTTAVTSLVKGHSALSLGNIIGANLFNIALVTGVSAVIAPFSVPQNTAILGVNAALLVELPVMLAAMLILTAPPLLRGKLTRIQGIVLLTIYALFCLYQFTAA
ncbi:MAG: calcium/sodium antiporter [Oscillospiraceae bacterium]|nr:calcium/sodium antiporter [Oscillospiraceae bacterium]